MEAEEEAVILVELAGIPNPGVILNCKGSCSILGIDTDEPILQLDDYVFQGKYEDVLGTHLIFKQHLEGKQLSYECKTSKKLRMTRVILKKKDSDGSKDNLSGQEGRTDTT